MPGLSLSGGNPFTTSTPPPPAPTLPPDEPPTGPPVNDKPWYIWSGFKQGYTPLGGTSIAVSTRWSIFAAQYRPDDDQTKGPPFYDPWNIDKYGVYYDSKLGGYHIEYPISKGPFNIPNEFEPGQWIDCIYTRSTNYLSLEGDDL
ncbi:MAG: hypothetical protein Q9224_006650, partial [Gallowayella concinna]